jgi:hypothetical protein
MIDTDDKSWMKEYLGEDFLGESQISMSELSFEMSSSKPIDSDYENAIRLYEALEHLNETQATDERLWVGLSFSIGYDYLVYRWGLDDYTKFKYRWIYYINNRRALFYHGLARLWWYTKLTVDESRENRYELTRFSYKHSEIMKNMVYRNYSSSPTVRMATLSALYEHEKSGGQISYKLLVELYKYINFLGGVTLLDSFEQKELEKRLSKKIVELAE